MLKVFKEMFPEGVTEKAYGDFIDKRKLDGFKQYEAKRLIPKKSYCREGDFVIWRNGYGCGNCGGEFGGQLDFLNHIIKQNDTIKE